MLQSSRVYILGVKEFRKKDDSDGTTDFTVLLQQEAQREGF